MDRKKELESREVLSGNTEQRRVETTTVQPEVESWMEKIEKKFARVPNQSQDVNDDSVVVVQDQSAQPPVTVPITHAQMIAGKKGAVTEGITWLVAWVVRQIKMLHKIGKKVRLADIPEVK